MRSPTTSAAMAAAALATDDDYSLERFGEDVEAVLDAVTPTASGRSSSVTRSARCRSPPGPRDHDVAGVRVAVALVNTGLVDLVTGHLLLGEAAAGSTAGRGPPLPGRPGAPCPSSPRRLPRSHPPRRLRPGGHRGPDRLLRADAAGLPAQVRAACGVAISDIDLHHAVERLSVPTLVVAGDRDRLTPPAHARRIAEALPHPAGLTILEETGHMSPLERPRELADALLTLARQTADAPAPA